MDLDFLEVFSKNCYGPVNLLLGGLTSLTRTVAILRVFPAVSGGVTFLESARGLPLVLVASSVVELADVTDVQEMRVVS